MYNVQKSCVDKLDAQKPNEVDYFFSEKMYMSTTFVVPITDIYFPRIRIEQLRNVTNLLHWKQNHRKVLNLSILIIFRANVPIVKNKYV